MSEKSVAQEGMKFARELQVKFELYFTGLIFTLLAASIQTGKFIDAPIQNGLELLGWIFLLVAGLASLSRLEWMPSNHETHARLQIAKETNRTWLQAQRSGRPIVNEDHEPWNIDENITKQTAAIEEVSIFVEQATKRSSIKHTVRSIAFLGGLGCVIASRAFEPTMNIARLAHAAWIK